MNKIVLKAQNVIKIGRQVLVFGAQAGLEAFLATEKPFLDESLVL
jgi:hypothetical protein